MLEVADYADGLASEHALSDVPTDFQEEIFDEMVAEEVYKSSIDKPVEQPGDEDLDAMAPGVADVAAALELEEPLAIVAAGEASQIDAAIAASTMLDAGYVSLPAGSGHLWSSVRPYIGRNKLEHLRNVAVR